MFDIFLRAAAGATIQAITHYFMHFSAATSPTSPFSPSYGDDFGYYGAGAAGGFSLI